MFSWKPGQLWLLDHQTQKTMVQQGLNVDKTFGVVFEKKAGPKNTHNPHHPSTITRYQVDLRDDRPLLYNGRFLYPSHVKQHENAWANSSLVTTGRTDSASQLATKDMLSVEDLSPEALPITTSDRQTRGGQRFQQLGSDACTKLLSALVEGGRAKPPPTKNRKQ